MTRHWLRYIARSSRLSRPGGRGHDTVVPQQGLVGETPGLRRRGFEEAGRRPGILNPEQEENRHQRREIALSDIEMDMSSNR